jgi:hypothetical protein
MGDNASTDVVDADVDDDPTDDDKGAGGSTTTDPDDGLPEAVKAVLAKERKNAREAVQRARAAEKERDAIKQAHMTESEKAIADARAEGKAEAMKTTGARLVDAEVKAAAAGRKGDVAALLEGLDRTRFLTDDGEPDTKAITAWVDKVLPAKAGPLDLGQGARGGGTTTDMNQLIRDRMRR